jgi:hypothetical protein
MRKLRRPQFLELLIAAVALLLIAAGPAVAETPAGETTEPAPESPSGGWVPQGETESSGEGGTGASQGSSIGSGSSPQPSNSSGSTAEAPAPEPTTGSSTAYSEPEPEPAPTSESQTSASREAPVAPVESPAPSPEPPKVTGKADLGDAVALTHSDPEQALVSAPADPAAAAPPASKSQPGSSGFGPLQILLGLACLLVLLYAGVRLVLGPVEPEMPAILRYATRRSR